MIHRFAGVIATTSFNTEEVAKKVSPKKRNCLTEGEKELAYFVNYSRSACFVECATKQMEEICKCRPYFFKGIHILTLKSSEFLKKNRIAIFRRQ